jgi:hypothetical protein
MNTETTILIAIALALLIVGIIFGAAQGGLQIGSDGVDNISDNTERDDDGDFSFTSGDLEGLEEKHFIESGEAFV